MLQINFPTMRALEFIGDHVTFKAPYDFSYRMKTPMKSRKEDRGRRNKQKTALRVSPFLSNTICSIARVILRICDFITMYKTVFFLDSTLYIFMVLFCMKNVCCLTGSFKLPKIRYCLLSASWTQPYSDNSKFSVPLKNCRQKKK